MNSEEKKWREREKQVTNFFFEKWNSSFFLGTNDQSIEMNSEYFELTTEVHFFTGNRFWFLHCFFVWERTMYNSP